MLKKYVGMYKSFVATCYHYDINRHIRPRFSKYLDLINNGMDFDKRKSSRPRNLNVSNRKKSYMLKYKRCG